MSNIKEMRRNICKAVGHEFENFICRRCKKKDSMLLTQDSVAGEVYFDVIQDKMVFYDGKNWIACK